MSVKARVTENTFGIGGGYWAVGKVLDVVAETACYFILSDNHRVNKKHMAIAGTATEHSVKVEIFTEVALRPFYCPGGSDSLN